MIFRYWSMVRSALRWFVFDQRGAELAEFALVLALVFVAAITALGVLQANDTIVLSSASGVLASP